MFKPNPCFTFNIGFHHPRKDQCATCAKYKLASAAEQEELRDSQAEHLHWRDAAQEAKRKETEEAMKGKDTVVATFDLQSVLQVPCSAASPFYYKRKICVYNLSVYETSSKKKTAHCFVWSEIDGKRGSNEIGSCLLKYIAQLPSEKKHLVLFSDCCSGQNRNQFTMAALLWAVQNSHLETIKMCFLESGHTQMECDSMHSTIENFKKNKSIYSVPEWVNIMIGARRRNPYIVHRLSFKDFFDLKVLMKMMSGNKNTGVLFNSVVGF